MKSNLPWSFDIHRLQ